MKSTVELESAVLGLLFQYSSLNEKITYLSKNDFPSGIYKSIFEIFYNVYKENGRIDKNIVLSQLDHEGKQAIITCAENAITPSAVDTYIDLLKKEASNKRLKSSISDLLLTDEITTVSVQKILEDEQRNGYITDCFQKSDDNLREFAENIGKEKELIETGFSEIDFKINGLEKGTFAIIGARPSTGKTTFALNIVTNQLKSKKQIIFFSLEMSSRMIYERLLSNTLSIDYNLFNRNTLNEKQQARVRYAVEILRKEQKFIVLDDVYSVENICNRILEVKPDVAVVDFIQIVDTVERFGDIRNKINYISAELKRVAKKTGCVVIALSQVTRTGKDAPSMSDLRESGALEQDGDYIIMLHRPYVSDKTQSDETTTQVLVDKNKFGWTGLFNFHFDVLHQRFTSLANNFSVNNDLPFD